MANLRQYTPCKNLKSCIDAFWFSENLSGGDIFFPVVPDGCSDIIFYLNDDKKLEKVDGTFVTGVMEYAEVIPIPDKMALFGIRFKPSYLYELIPVDFSQLVNEKSNLKELNNELYSLLQVDMLSSDDLKIVSRMEKILEKLFIREEDSFLNIVGTLSKEPNIAIRELAERYGYTVKTLERQFYRRVGISPKKFARIMRFQMAHSVLTKEGLNNLVMVALGSGYFDQAHFNREYKKLVGFAPSSETMSILYNTDNV